MTGAQCGDLALCCSFTCQIFRPSGLLQREKPSGLFEGTTNISPYLAEFVRSSFFESHTDAGGIYTPLQKFTNLQLHSEMVSEDEMFREHFNYRREGSWHDWVNVQRERIVTKGGVQTKVEFTNSGRVLLFVTYYGISFPLQQQEAQSKEQSGDLLLDRQRSRRGPSRARALQQDRGLIVSPIERLIETRAQPAPRQRA